MSTLVDTSVIVRYIVDEPPEQGQLATALIESDRSLAISTVALAEAAFVLTRGYGVPRSAAVDALVALVGRPNVSVVELPKGDAIEALMLCRPSGRVSFADALLWATARTTRERRVVTFDQRFPDIDIERVLLA